MSVSWGLPRILIICKSNNRLVVSHVCTKCQTTKDLEEEEICRNEVRKEFERSIFNASDVLFVLWGKTKE